MANNSDAPKWVSDAVFYQIFPDRFANGSKANDPDDVQEWDAEPNGKDWMGGDLAGIRKHFDYLDDLGVNALYFNPLFAAQSNHAYDTTDYEKIDSRFGTNAQFKKLVEEAHERGWHVILDGVFPHVGTDFAPFQDVLAKGEQSEYKDWFTIHKFPVQIAGENEFYESWDGVPSMPLLNLENPAVREYQLNVGAKWVREFGIDGWRLDSAERPGHAFWKAFRERVKAENREAYLVGEIWSDAHAWLHGDEFDAVMNYPWRSAAFSFFAQDELTPTDFNKTLTEIRDSYPVETLHTMLNMLSSHDAERLATRCNGDALRVGQCVLFQIAYPGVPCIYYGDEIGLEGDKDPLNRRGMVWNKKHWNTGLRDFYKKLIKLRREKKALRHGDYQTVLLHDANGLFGFRRQFENESILALFNNSDAAQCAEILLDKIGDTPYRDWIGSGVELETHDGLLTVSIPARGLALLGTD